jgi:membrane-bound lytic murein transglycosylase MltF
LSDSLQSLGLKPIHIEPVDPYLEVEDLLEMVSSGGIPFTAMMEDAARLWSNVLDSLSLYGEFPISQNVSFAWAFRKESPQLKKYANEFLKQNRKGSLLGNMLYNKYVKKDQSINNKYSSTTLAQVRSLEVLFKAQAEKYNLDWLLLVAQGYQESKLNQKLVSRAGAVGIMQVKPSTAAGKPINIKNVYTAENNVEAGAKYLRYVIDQFFDDEGIDHFNRELMALASYNAGPNRIALLRKKTLLAGLDPNIWFDNVEIIAAREIGRETVQYVSNIYKFYSSYKYLREYSKKRGKTVLPE